MADEHKIEIEDGERVDQIADRAFGDPAYYRRLIEDNPELDIFYPLGGDLVTINR